MKKIFSSIALGAALMLSSAFVNSCQKAPKEIVEIEFTNVLTPITLTGDVTSAGDVVKVNWSKSKGAESFELEFYSDELLQNLEKSVVVLPEELPISIKLDIDKKYYYRVRGVSKTLQPSKWAVFTDKEGNPSALKTYAVKSSANPELVERTSTSITVSWELPIGDTELTHLLAVDNKGNETEAQITDLSAGVVTVEDLTPSTQYTVSLCYKSAKRGSLSAWTRPAMDGSETVVTTSEELTQAVLDGAHNIVVAYSDEAYLAGTMTVSGDFNIRGVSAVDGTKPVINGSFEAAAGLTSVHIEDLDLCGEAAGEITQQGSALTLGVESLSLTDVEIVNCIVRNYIRGIFSDSKGNVVSGHVLIDGVIEQNIKGDGGDNIDARNSYNYGELLVRNSTFTTGCRTFMRLDAKGKVGAIEFTNNTVNNLLYNGGSLIIGGSNVKGIFYVRGSYDSFKVSKNLFLNNNCWLVASDSASKIPEFDKNYTFNCVDQFYTSAKLDGTSPKSGMSKDVVVKNGASLANDPCYNSADGIFNLTESTLVNAKIGDPRWFVNYIPVPEDLTLNVTKPVKTWDFTDKAIFKSPVDVDMVRDGIRFYVKETPVEIDNEKGAVLFQAPSTVSSIGVVSDGAIAFKVDQPGSVVLSTIDNGKNNATLIVSLDGKPKAAAVVGSQNLKVVLDGIQEGQESIITLYCTERIGLSFLQWSDDTETGETQLAAPVVSLDKTSVNMGAEETVTLSWDAVGKAGSYDVYCNEAKVASVTDPSYSIATKTFEAGDYAYAVQAMPASSDKTRKASEMSNSVTLSVVEILHKVDAKNATVWDSEYMTAGVEKYGKNVELTSNFVYQNLGFLAGGGKFKFGIDNEDTAPKPRVQLGGTGVPGTKCNVQIMVAGPGSLEIVARSGGSDVRKLMIANGSSLISETGYDAVNKELDPAAISEEPIAIDSKDGDIINIYSKSGGINIYSITWTPAESPEPEPEPEGEYGIITFDSAAGLSTEYKEGSLTLSVNNEATKMTVDANTAYFGTADKYSKFTSRLKTGGKSSSTLGLSLTVAEGSGKLRICARTGSGSATDRNIVLTDSKGTEVLNEILLDSNYVEVTPEGEEKAVKVYKEYIVDVTAGTYALTFPVNSVNFYCFEFTPDSK